MSYKVGGKIKDGSGNEWVTSRIWENPHYFDLELIRTATGQFGALSVPITNEAGRPRT